jgi:lycopene cyclase domain-containing protein
MTYFGFLGYFLVIPLLILGVLTYWDVRRGRRLPASLRTLSPVGIVLAHVVIAVTYTTPWDNYLVATRVWWYDPELVTGIVIGWVPIEEYTFFVLQTLFTGMWTVFLARRLVRDDDGILHATPQSARTAQRWRYGLGVVGGVAWLGSVALFISNWEPGTYLALELMWALPPIIFQLVFGADILWHYRRVVFWALVPTTIYLCVGDAIAIGSGTWTINPAQSTGVLVGNLPIEEIIFFFVTNVLVVFGTVLMLAQASQQRVPKALMNWLSRGREVDASLSTEQVIRS